MKTIFTSLALFAICMSSSSQNQLTIDPLSDAINDNYVVLDSTIMYTKDALPKSKKVYSYNKTAEKEMVISFYWDNNWKQVNKYIYKYDSRGNKILEEYYGRWDATNNEWIGTNKHVNEYDAKGNLLLTEEYISWDQTTKLWGGKSKGVYKYDDNGNQTLIEAYLWGDNMWQGDFKYINEYDEKGNLTLKEYYNVWNNDVWTGSTKHIYDYDSNNNQTLMERYNWDNSTEKWLESTKTINAYNADSNPTLEERYSWNKSAGIWTGTYKSTNSYNEDGNISKSEYYYEWIGKDREFALSEYMIYYYGDNSTDIRSERITLHGNTHIKDGVLYINTPVSETVNIYNIGGQIIRTIEKKEDETSVNVKGLPGLLIVKGDSGWSSKIINAE